jgi:hypothetical protein
VEITKEYANEKNKIIGDSNLVVMTAQIFGQQGTVHCR